MHFTYGRWGGGKWLLRVLRATSTHSSEQISVPEKGQCPRDYLCIKRGCSPACSMSKTGHE